MLRLSDIRISTKLAVASGFGILIVVGMIAGQYVSSRNLNFAAAEQNRLSEFAEAAAESKAAIRGYQIGAKDARLASNVQELAAAEKYIAARHEVMRGLTKKLLEKAKVQTNIDRINALMAESEGYYATSKESFAKRAEMLQIKAKTAGGVISDVDQARVTTLEAEASKIVREKSLPAAEKMGAMADELLDAVKKLDQESDVVSAAARTNAEYLAYGLSLIVIAVQLVTAIFAAVSIAKPLRRLVKPIEDLATGNFAVTVPGRDRKDEVGLIANAVGQMAQRVSETIGNIKTAAREVTNASGEISSSTTDLSQRTEEQAASLEQTSASMEEISATVKKNAENAHEANQSASTTQSVADRGGAVVAKAVEAMAKIEDSSRKISDIIGVIDEIARQTNLLALNAAVEAARAGDAGRGFAVVASEVRSLAQRSSQAAKDIKDLITNSNSQVKDGVELVNQAGSALNEIMGSIKSVTTIISEIASASAEQATGLDEINKAMAQMDEVTQQNSALVEENAATAKTLENQAQAMDEQVAFFQLGDGAASEAAKPVSAKIEHGKYEHTKPAKIERAAPAARAVRAARPKVAEEAVEVAPKRAAAGGGGPVGRMQTALATAVKSDADWKEF